MKNKLKILALSTFVMASNAMAAEASDPVSNYLSAINLTAVAAGVVGIGVVIVGISMSEKGISIAKRVIGKA